MRNNLDALYGGARIDALMRSTYSRGQEKESLREGQQKRRREEEKRRGEELGEEGRGV